jgi:prepilin-type N-terminal cleavage/methylation domain-containing protein
MSIKHQWSWRSSGFTLLELAVTVGVVGVLVAVAIPTYTAYHRNESKVECQASVLNFLNAQQLYYLDNHTFYPLRPGQVTGNAGVVTIIGWDPNSRPAPAERYLLPELAMEFKREGHRGYKIRAVNVQKQDMFNQALFFTLRTNEGFHNDGLTDYEYTFKMFNRQQPTSQSGWSTHGQWMIRNGFWFDIFRCPAWQWTPACLR